MDSIPIIRAVNLTKRFGKRTSVNKLNLTVYQGELYALLGDNGAGKTTTLNMLTTLLKPSEGEFYISEFNGITQAEQVKGVFGVVSQDIVIYNELTAYENLKFIASLYRLSASTAKERIEKLLLQSGLKDRANDLVQTFSDGMRRRLTIASALLHEPRVLFMDEPTVGLDPVARRQIWSTLASLRDQGVTILLTTHYLEEAEILADRVGIIRQGVLVASGTIDELRKKIQAIRNVEVRLGGHFQTEIINQKIASLDSQLGMRIEYDTVHNILLFTRPKDTGNGAEFIHSLRNVLQWLEKEEIPISSFSTNEPNLEDVFLAVTKNGMPA